MQLPIEKNIAMLVGAGAVKNSWQPIQRAMNDIGFIKNTSSETANSFLARLIYLLRWSYGMKYLNDDYGFEEYKRIYNSTKSRICDQIKTSMANNELIVQDEFNFIVNKLLLSQFKKALIVNTNWDTVFEDTFNENPILKKTSKKIRALHVHGTYDNPATLYLPTEICDEPYRSSHEENFHGKTHLDFIDNLEFANVLIIYGLSLSPLDAELTQHLHVALYSSNIEQVVIIDCNPQIIIDRLTAFLPFEREIAISSYKPSDLLK